MYNMSNLCFFNNYIKKERRRLVISQELREVMAKIERLKPEWEICRVVRESESFTEADMVYIRCSISFRKRTDVGIINCTIEIVPTEYSGGYFPEDKEGAEVSTHYAHIIIHLAKHSCPDNFVKIFDKNYDGAKYALIIKRSFWKNYITNYEKRLTKKPSEEYLFLRKYVATMSENIFKIKTRERLIAEQERQQKYQQQEQECKNIFFGK